MIGQFITFTELLGLSKVETNWKSFVNEICEKLNYSINEILELSKPHPLLTLSSLARNWQQKKAIKEY